MDYERKRMSVRASTQWPEDVRGSGCEDAQILSLCIRRWGRKRPQDQLGRRLGWSCSRCGHWWRAWDTWPRKEYETTTFKYGPCENVLHNLINLSKDVQLEITHFVSNRQTYVSYSDTALHSSKHKSRETIRKRSVNRFHSCSDKLEDDKRLVPGIHVPVLYQSMPRTASELLLSTCGFHANKKNAFIELLYSSLASIFIHCAYNQITHTPS
jgi:hypothetical protein